MISAFSIICPKVRAGALPLRTHRAICFRRWSRD